MINDKSESLNLFERLPDDIFRPLTGKNNRLFWGLLEVLYARFFGPDAMPPREDGFLQRDLTIEIERYLMHSNSWEEEDDKENVQQGTSLNVRANNIVERLVESGWIRAEPKGVRIFMSMHPHAARRKYPPLLWRRGSICGLLANGRLMRHPCLAQSCQLLLY